MVKGETCALREHKRSRNTPGLQRLEHDRQHKITITTILYWGHLLKNEHVVPSDVPGNSWHKLNSGIKQTLKRQSEDVEGRKREHREQQTAWEDYYSVIRVLWSRTDMDRSRFPASHTSICHFTMQRIHTHTPPHTHTHRNNTHSKAKQACV